MNELSSFLEVFCYYVLLDCDFGANYTSKLIIFSASFKINSCESLVMDRKKYFQFASKKEVFVEYYNPK